MVQPMKTNSFAGKKQNPMPSHSSVQPKKTNSLGSNFFLISLIESP